MATTCSRELSITIADPLPEPFFYYKLDSFDGTNIIDSVAARNMAQTAGTDPTVVPAKIADGFEYAFGGSLFIASRSNADTNITGLDVTMRCWIFPTTGSEHEINIELRSGTSRFFELRTNTIGATQDAFARIRTNVVSPNVEISTPLIENQWNHVMVWHENGVEIGVRVNNGAPATIAHITGIESTSSLRLDYLANNATAVILDEIAIWKQLLTTAQQNADWNGGVGVTYPF